MFVPTLLASLLVIAGPPQPAATDGPTPGTLKWVRGHVTSTTPDSIALTLKDKPFVAIVTPSTEVVRKSAASIAQGSLVEIHFTEKNDRREAVIVLADPPADSKLTNRVGRSYRAVVRNAKRSAINLRVERRNRDVKLDKKTRLSDATGAAWLAGAKEIAGRLAAGDLVLVTFDEQSDDLIAGDMTIPGTAHHAREIRVLRPANQN